MRVALSRGAGTCGWLGFAALLLPACGDEGRFRADGGGLDAASDAIVIGGLDLLVGPSDGTVLPPDGSVVPPDATVLPDGTLPPPVDGAVPPADLTSGPPDLLATCDPPAAAGDGHHNPGLVCTSCHGSIAPAWTVSGTLYSDAAGTAPVAGATLHVIDANQQEIALVTATNGNFFTGQAVAYPVTVSASRCPDTIRMNGAVGAPGTCNSCHGAGFRVHLP